MNEILITIHDASAKHEHCSTKECLFCLEYTYNELLSDTDETIAEKSSDGSPSMTKHELQNFEVLFPCECAVYAHPTCLQTWLSYKSACPICNTRMRLDSVDDQRLQHSSSLHVDLSTLHNIHTECSCCMITQRLLYISVGILSLYFLFGHALHIAW